MSTGMPSRWRTLKRPIAAAHLTEPEPMTTAMRLRRGGVSGAMRSRLAREARHGGVRVAVELQDAGEAREIENAQDVRLHGGEAQVAPALPRLLHRLEQGPEARARRVVHPREVADDADEAAEHLLAERGDESRRRRAVDAALDGDDGDLGAPLHADVHDAISFRRRSALQLSHATTVLSRIAPDSCTRRAGCRKVATRRCRDFGDTTLAAARRQALDERQPVSVRGVRPVIYIVHGAPDQVPAEAAERPLPPARGRVGRRDRLRRKGA